ncbi:competence protein CoiA [Planococcus sp. ANT_H30]|uniref:competence protein CoiA n=1 Tax=Planococcus sp. ANT_H30 TaxID=2597347 RepID=UPI0021D3D2A6|nr:competence protein CoiA family protein [Planococcus sp. ANT_H30]
MITILVAKTKRQELFYLTGKHTRQELQEIRLQEQFYCPSCQASLLLKIGQINIPHFAHKTLSDCDHSGEPESSLHLHGKLLLYHFFQQLKFNVELEQYLPPIRQRADLLVDSHYAIEFQCSSIPVSQLVQRSKGYLTIGIQPIWIKGLKEPCQEEIGLLRIKSDELAMRQSAGQVSFILLFYPPNNQFYYQSNLFYVGPNRWVGKTKSLQATKQIFPFALPKSLSKEEFKVVMEVFYQVKKKYIRNQLYAENRIKNVFCRLCYELRVDVMNVPKLVGIPLLGADCIKQPAILWQLQVVVAYDKGISIAALVASGKLTLTNPALTQQAVLIMEDYLSLYVAFKDKKLENANLLDIVYDIYCKNLRKLRK